MGASTPALPSQPATAPDPNLALMAKVAGGDQQAFADLYDQLAPSVWGLVRNVVDDPIAAQQAMFDALVSVWAHARFFEPGTGSVQLWVSSIAHQRAVAHRAR